MTDVWRLAIVGSVSLAGHPEAQKHIEDVLDEFQPAVVVSGGAAGIDTMAAEEALRRGLVVREYLPKTRRWEDGFKPRNMQITEDCDFLVRIVASDSKTYGSGWTRDRVAERLGKDCTREYVVAVDGSGDGA